jgi:hypothetical protein
MPIRQKRRMSLSQQSRSVDQPRRGSAYILILGVSMIVAALAYGALLVTRAKGRTAVELSDAAQARQYARDAIELGRVWISQDVNWRTNRTSGVWVSNQPIGSGTFTLEASDPLDGNIANLPHDLLVLKATAAKGNARHVLQVTLQARPVALPVLQYALHVGGELNISTAKTLDVTGGTASTDGALKNDGTILGNIDVATVANIGTVSGTQTIGSPPKGVPSASIFERYAALGTLISPGAVMQQVVLGPGYNPYGTPNPYGVYVVRPSSAFLVENCRVYGTLVVICPPGNRVTIDKAVLMQACRSDMPALLVQGEAEIRFDSGPAALSELLLSTNFNPMGAAFDSISDTDALDVYPSEIRGLVHVSDRVRLDGSPLIQGALICSSPDNSNACRIDGLPSIHYTPGLFTNPPLWYTTRVDLPIERGSWRQLAN